MLFAYVFLIGYPIIVAAIIVATRRWRRQRQFELTSARRRRLLEGCRDCFGEGCPSCREEDRDA